MPTKKRRVGFIPREVVLDLINKLSFESNLSNSKIINILVEEALHKRGIFNINTGEVFLREKNYSSDELYRYKNVVNSNHLLNDNKTLYKNNEDQNRQEAKEDFIDREIYEKFLMFLQFQEKMKTRDI